MHVVYQCGINLRSFISTNIYKVKYIIMIAKYIDNNKTMIIKYLTTIIAPTPKF